MIDYAFHHCECVLRIVRGDASALNDMDISADGFWRSFWAMAFAFPALFFTWVASAQDLMAQGVVGSLASLIVKEVGIELFAWLLPIFAFALLLPRLGLGNSFTPLIIARNWLTAILSYVVAAVLLAETLIPSAGDGALILLFFIVLGVSLWMVTRITIAAFQGHHLAAYSLVAAELLIMLSLVGVLSSWLGLVAPL
ncbi:MAG: hypothetical protein AAGG69_01240 [Pseudomonadota bacterium]